MSDIDFEIVLPFWMKIMFSPWILGFMLIHFIGSVVCWKLIFSSSGEDVLNEDKKRSVFLTWLTLFLCNLGSCIVLLIIEYIMRMVSTSGISLDSLTIWDSPLTVTVYAIPILISFFIISGQIRHRAHYLISDRIPARITSWVMSILFSPWFILIPSSVVWNLTDQI